VGGSANAAGARGELLLLRAAHTGEPLNDSLSQGDRGSRGALLTRVSWCGVVWQGLSLHGPLASMETSGASAAERILLRSTLVLSTAFVAAVSDMSSPMTFDEILRDRGLHLMR
jgi:hypothetical protein